MKRVFLFLGLLVATSCCTRQDKPTFTADNTIYWDTNGVLNFRGAELSGPDLLDIAHSSPSNTVFIKVLGADAEPTDVRIMVEGFERALMEGKKQYTEGKEPLTRSHNPAPNDPFAAAAPESTQQDN